MLKIKRYVNNEFFEKNDLYKNEISDDTVYKIINKVKERVTENKQEGKRNDG